MISNLNGLVNCPQNPVVEFIHSDAPAYARCGAQVTISIDGNWVTLPRYSLRTGGSVWFDDDWDEHVEYGPWTIRDDALPENLRHLKNAVEAVINNNLPQGCCGGCI